VLVSDNDSASRRGRFSVIAPPDPDAVGASSIRYGVIDECGKINLNALLKLDSSGSTAQRLLMALPNMTEEIANSITSGIASGLSVAALVVMVVHAARRGDGWCVAACAIFGASLILSNLSSTLYHAIAPPRAKRVFRVFDHLSIYFLIAGTYAPFGLIVMSRAWAIPILAIVWGGAFLAILMKLFWVRAPKWLSAAIALTLGWVAAAAFPQLLKLSTAALLLVVAGGILYTAGAIIYARRRPDPIPHVFGYHELFHVLTLGAVGCQYAAIAFFVLPG